MEILFTIVFCAVPVVWLYATHEKEMTEAGHRTRTTTTTTTEQDK